MNPWLVTWLPMAMASLWVGVTAAGVRRELALLEQGAPSREDYALIALLHRLQDDAVGLALRLRLSRVFSVVFLCMSLVGLGAILAPRWSPFLGLAGWLAVVGLEMGAGQWAHRLGAWRGGTGYAVWARLTSPGARLVKPLLRFRTARPPEEERVRVLAESRATLMSGGGQLGRSERRFLRRLLASTNILVADILTRWDAVARVDADTPAREAAGVAKESGHSRLAVTRDWNVVGLIKAKDLLPRIHDPERRDTPVGSFLRPVYFVRQEATVQGLLEELQESHSHLAVVVDRLGRTVGIVTMEDILEEIVGELYDEREREGGAP